MASSATGGSSREDTAKAIVADQISQAVQSTSNLLHLMQQSSLSQAQLQKLPKSLLAKLSTIKNTGQVLEQMPQVISTLDAHMEDGLRSVPHLKTVIQLLTNMESNQLSSLTQKRQINSSNIAAAACLAGGVKPIPSVVVWSMETGPAQFQTKPMPLCLQFLQLQS